jgi:hypothetical protein
MIRLSFHVQNVTYESLDDINRSKFSTGAAGRDTGTTILVIPVFYQYLPVSAILVQILVNTSIPVSSRIFQYLQY